MMKKFLICYEDPYTKDLLYKTCEFEDSYDPVFISAKNWAEDYAYSLADKGWNHVTEIHTTPSSA